MYLLLHTLYFECVNVLLICFTVDDPKKYILFCGLRSHAELNRKLVSEFLCNILSQF